MAIEFPTGLGNITYEHDLFCISEDTPLLRKRGDEIRLCFVKDFIDGDEVISINKEIMSQEWKKVKVKRYSAPPSLCQIRAKTLFEVTHTHKMLRPDFTVEAAGNLREEDKLLSIDCLDLPEDTNALNFIDYLENPPKWMCIRKEGEDISYIRYRGRGTPKKCFEGNIPSKIELNYQSGLLFGLYLAEGSSQKNSINFTFNVDEEELSSFIEESTFNLFKIKTKLIIYPDCGRRVSFIHNKVLAYIWRILFSGDCYTKQIPSFVYKSNKEFKRGLIHGWLFGDGDFNGRTIRGTSASKLLAYGMHNLLLSLGIKNSISKEANVYRILFAKKESIKKLFPEDVIWKHFPKIKEHLESEFKYSREEIEDLFNRYYKAGMAQADFLAIADITQGPILRIYGSWDRFLKEHNLLGYAQRSINLNESELLILGKKWIDKRNGVFNIKEWNKDPSVPSEGPLYRVFGGGKAFKKRLSTLSTEELEALENVQKIEEKIQVSSESITFIREIEYGGEWIYDLEVEDNENFLIGAIVSHNSGSQTLCYFENVLVDDIVRIAWGTQQVRTPVFGYASQYYNALAAGNIISAGSFWIGFKEAGYMPIILRHITSLRSGDDEFFATPASSPSSGGSHSTGLRQSADEWEGNSQEGGARVAGRVLRGQIERLLERQAADPDNIEVQRDLQNLAVQLQALQDREFEDLAELFEDALWYGGNSAEGGRGELFSGNLAGGVLSEDGLLALRRADQYPPFDIFITFGDMNNPAANHTIYRLLDVTITNTEFGGIENTGEPIYVKYDFICRNSG